MLPAASNVRPIKSGGIPMKQPANRVASAIRNDINVIHTMVTMNPAMNLIVNPFLPTDTDADATASGTLVPAASSSPITVIIPINQPNNCVVVSMRNYKIMIHTMPRTNVLGHDFFRDSCWHPGKVAQKKYCDPP